MIDIFYHPQMVKENGGFSPSSFKPAQVVADWQSQFGSELKINTFRPLEKEDFYKIHQQDYVEGIFNGSVTNGYGLKSKEFSEVFCLTSGSLYAASKTALKSGIAVSPSSGFHHARWNKSEGFCTFNGLVLVSVLLKEKGFAQKIGILDFDMHYGNGTDEIIDKYHLDYIVHYTAGKKYDFNYPLLNFLKPLVKKFYNKKFNKAKGDETAKPLLRQKILSSKGPKFINEIDNILLKFKDCDLIIYQAGADQHIDDPYGGLLTYEQMQTRDKKVFEFAKNHNIPLVWNLAGGYQKDSQGTIEPVLKCHRNTMKECIEVYQK